MKKMMMVLTILCAYTCVHANKHECCVTMSPSGDGTYTVDKSGCVNVPSKGR